MFAEMTPEMVTCSRCGKRTDVLEIFPGKVCLQCWERTEGRKPLTRSDFDGMVRTFRGKAVKRG